MSSSYKENYDKETGEWPKLSKELEYDTRELEEVFGEVIYDQRR